MMNVNKNLRPVRGCGRGDEADEPASRETTGLPARLGELSLGLRPAGNWLCRQPALTQVENLPWRTEEWRGSVNRFAPKALKRADRPWFYFYPMPEEILSRSAREYGDHLLGA